MTKLGTFITVNVDPASNGGFDTAPALVTGEHDDGSLRIRVFGANAAGDVERNYVGDDGEPYDYGTDQPAAGAPAPSAAASTPVTAGSLGASQPPPAPAVPTVDQLRGLTPEQRAELLAELEQIDQAQPPTTDGTPGAGTAES